MKRGIGKGVGRKDRGNIKEFKQITEEKRK